MQSHSSSTTPQDANGAAFRGFDLDRALERFGGDHALFQDLVETFFEDTPRTLQDIRCALARGDVAAVARGAHRLKGTLAYYGVDSLIEALRAIEQLTPESGPQAVQLAVETVEAEVECLRQALLPHRRSPGA